MRQAVRPRPLVIGVTGGFGTGKSTVSRMLQAKGCLLVDADRLAHACLRRPHPVARQVIEAFGESVCGSPGSISRKRLAETVFADPRALKKLTRLVHPAVTRRIIEIIARSSRRCVVCDVPLLFESGLEGFADIRIVVTAKEKVQIARLNKRRGLPERQIRARINVQMPLEKKERLADFVIDNNGTVSATRKKVESIWKRVQSMIRKQ